MTETLPLRIRTGIRDHWESPGCSFQVARQEIKELVGKEVEIDPEWRMLWTALQKHYSDPSIFVPVIGNTVDAWFRALSRILVDEQTATLADELLGKIMTSGAVRVVISLGKQNGPTTAWLEEKGAFQIVLSESGSILGHSIQALFYEGLLHCLEPKKFEESVDPEGSATLTDRTIPVRGDDSWETVEKERSAPMSDPKYSASKVVPERVPTVNAIERPEELMLRPPYFMTVTHSLHSKDVLVQGSHEPSLKLLADYLTRWCKKNNNHYQKAESQLLKLELLKYPMIRSVPYPGIGSATVPAYEGFRTPYTIWVTVYV